MQISKLMELRYNQKKLLDCLPECCKYQDFIDLRALQMINIF